MSSYVLFSLSDEAVEIPSTPLIQDIRIDAPETSPINIGDVLSVSPDLLEAALPPLAENVEGFSSPVESSPAAADSSAGSAPGVANPMPEIYVTPENLF